MRLIRPVATDAVGSQLLTLRHCRVTGMAVEGGVRALEGKLEARQMIERTDFPHIVAMAVGAIRPQAAGVAVVAFVAAGAVLGNRLLQIAAAMAVAAADACVPSQQRKARFTRMVELLRYP